MTHVTLPIERLDRSRAYATVHGEDPYAQAFAQNGLGLEGWPYDAAGVLIEVALSPAQRSRLGERREMKRRRLADENLKPATTKATPLPTTVEELQKALRETQAKLDASVNADVEEGGDDEDGTNLKAPSDDIHLLEWLNGNEVYKAFEIQKTIKERFGANKPSFAAAAKFLVEEKNLTTWDKVRPDLRPPDWKPGA